jgi:hypothetical protein
MTSLARWVSIVAHPFVTTLVMVGAIELHRGWAAAARSVTMVALLAFLPLAVLMRRQVRSGAWTNVDASHPHERPVLFLVGGAGLLALLGYLAVAHPDSPLLRGAMGALVMVAICAAVTPWVKVSLHMAAASLATAVLLSRGLPAGWLLAAVLPLLAWARVALGRHRWIEVALGFLAGSVTGVILARMP